MTRRIGKSALNWGFFITILIWISGCSEGALPITELDVKHVLRQIDRSAEQKNASLAAAVLSDDVEIHVRVTTPNGTEEKQLSKQDYIQQLEQSFQMMSRYAYEKENVKIDINPDQDKAKVDMDVLETFVMQGQLITSTSHAKAEMQYENGALVVTRLNVVGELEM